MRRTLIALIACLPALACGAARPPEGRWEGRVEIPGSELQLIVDLAQGSAGGWTGSIVIPGLGIKGAALSNVVVTDTDVAFDIGKVLGTPAHGPAGFRAHLIAADGMAGEMRQAGNVAQFALTKIGPAQVESSPRSTAVRPELEDQWIGEYELGGYPRRVTITLENHADAAASAKFVIVGKMTNDLPVDLVVQQGNLLRVESQSTQVYFEGRIFTEAGEIRGTIEVGPVELPLVLRRSSRRTS
jgi:hypothetical protein